MADGQEYTARMINLHLDDKWADTDIREGRSTPIIPPTAGPRGFYSDLDLANGSLRPVGTIAQEVVLHQKIQS